MATFQMYSFRTLPLSVDTNVHNYSEEDRSSILDETILDPGSLDSGLEMSPPITSSRRESFAVPNTPMFSPKPDNWQNVDLPAASSNNSFAEHRNGGTNNKRNNNHNGNPFVRLESPPSMYIHGQWPLGEESRISSSIQGHDRLTATCEADAPIFPRAMQNSYTTSVGQQMPLFSPTNSSEPIAASPQRDWSVIEMMEHHGAPKRMRPQSPTHRSHPEFSRRVGGIRKKNARFDIPAERNLTNIDQLISQSTDEQEIKELKQQKRLLRNRQAALDSRQRKKQHTERLEDEKKHFTSVISDLEDDLAEAKHTINDLLRKQSQYQQFLENLQMEKEEMIRHHTIESGDLRKKVSVLTDHIQRLEMSNVSTSPAPNPGFTSNFVDMDGLSMGNLWENMSFLNEFGPEAEGKIESSLVSSINKKTETTIINDSEKPIAQGLLLMLLLFGAFVASKGSSPSIPQVSEDVRAASATLLEDIFHDAGVAGISSTSISSPQPSNGWCSGGGTGAPVISMGGNEISGMTQSRLGDLADSLTQPTEEQKNEQLFSLTAAQYNGLISLEFPKHMPPKSTSQGRRNLGETLAAMRNYNRKETAAEVYTRSLLWDQVPSEVVRNFARMVSECNSQSTTKDEASSIK